MVVREIIAVYSEKRKIYESAVFYVKTSGPVVITVLQRVSNIN
jgi:hypothetical protein